MVRRAEKQSEVSPIFGAEVGAGCFHHMDSGLDFLLGFFFNFWDPFEGSWLGMIDGIVDIFTDSKAEVRMVHTLLAATDVVPFGVGIFGFRQFGCGIKSRSCSPLLPGIVAVIRLLLSDLEVARILCVPVIEGTVDIGWQGVAVFGNVGEVAIIIRDVADCKSRIVGSAVKVSQVVIKQEHGLNVGESPYVVELVLA